MAEIVNGTTRFMAGKYPFMMFGLMGAALAMYRTAKPEKKKVVGGLLGAAAFTAMLTGITEPIEFTFLFVAPALFVVHAILAGTFIHVNGNVRCIYRNDILRRINRLYFIRLLPAGAGVQTNWHLLLMVGVVYFALYYFLFKFLIVKFNLKTPGT